MISSFKTIYMCKARGIESHIKIQCTWNIKKKKTKTNGSPAGEQSYKYSNSSAWCRAKRSEWLDILQKGILCCAVKRKRDGREKGEGWREIITIISVKQRSTQGWAVHPSSRRELKGGMIIFEGLVASMWYCHNTREIDLNWILVMIKESNEAS